MTGDDALAMLPRRVVDPLAGVPAPFLFVSVLPKFSLKFRGGCKGVRKISNVSEDQPAVPGIAGKCSARETPVRGDGEMTSGLVAAFLCARRAARGDFTRGMMPDLLEAGNVEAGFQMVHLRVEIWMRSSDVWRLCS